MSAFIDTHRERFGVEPICRTLDVSGTAYYERRDGERSAREREDERLLALIGEAPRELRSLRPPADVEGAPPPRRARPALRGAAADARARDPGRQAARTPVAHHHARSGRRATSGPRRARLHGVGPGELLVADLSYVRCWEGVVFFAFVLDVFSRTIVGWQLATRPARSAALRLSPIATPLDQALRRPIESAQYTSAEFAAVLAENAVAQSVGSTGDAYDNAMAESFVDTFKTELIADRVWKARSQLEFAIVEWVGWYNTRRLHEALGDVPPVEFELAHLATSGPLDHRAGGLSLRSPYGLAALDPAAPADTLLVVEPK